MENIERMKKEEEMERMASWGEIVEDGSLEAMERRNNENDESKCYCYADAIAQLIAEEEE